MRAISMVLAAALMGGCAPDAEEASRVSARGTATGSVGAVRESDQGQDPDAADVALAGDSATGSALWTAGRVQADSRAGGVAVQQALRVATHEEYDRVVLDFGTDSLPGYEIEYIDRPVRACGSGEVVELPGDAWLMIRLMPAAAHDDQGHATIESRDLPVDLPVIARVRSTCDFEGVVTWVAAVRSPEPFRVIELRSPSRLVVDVRR